MDTARDIISEECNAWVPYEVLQELRAVRGSDIHDTSVAWNT